MENNNSLTYSVNVWLFSILLLPLLIFFYGSYTTEESSWGEFLLSIILFPIVFGAITIPLHVLFVYLNKYMFKTVQREWLLRFLINLNALAIGLPVLYLMLRATHNYFLKVPFLFIFLDVILISVLVWTLKIERGKVDEKFNSPKRPDLLDDGF